MRAAGIFSRGGEMASWRGIGVASGGSAMAAARQPKIGCAARQRGITHGAAAAALSAVTAVTAQHGGAKALAAARLMASTHIAASPQSGLWAT